MAPDLVMVLGQPALRSASHSLVGAVAVDLPLVAVTWLLWAHLVREPGRQLLPGVGARWRPTWAGSRGQRLARRLAAAPVGHAPPLPWGPLTPPRGPGGRDVPPLPAPL